MSLLNSNGLIWMDGEFIPWKEACVHVLAHTLHYGVGVFEGVRAYKTEQGTAIFRLQDHTTRLFQSAHILNMPIPYTKDYLNEIQRGILIRNNLQAAYLRPMVFYGAEKLGLHTKKLPIHVLVAAWEWKKYMEGVDIDQGIKVKVSSFTRNYANSVMCKAKANGNYMNSILALREAQDCGYDEALLLDREGFVSEGSGENIFIIRNGNLYTPDVTSALDGITRDSVCVLARALGLSVQEKRITRDEVYISDEAFFTGTASEITPIREVDGRVIGKGKKGEITAKIQNLFAQVVRGKSDLCCDWLTFISEASIVVTDEP